MIRNECLGKGKEKQGERERKKCATLIRISRADGEKENKSWDSGGGKLYLYVL